MDLDAIVEELGAVLAASDSPRRTRTNPGADKKWRAGDLVADLSKNDRDLVAEKVGMEPGLLRSYAEVASAYPPEKRTVRAAWTIYRELRILTPERREEVFRDGLTLRQARLAIGKGPMDRPRKDRQTHQERAWFVVEELQDPVIRAIVESEMKAAGADRRARKAAKSTLDEIAARRKYIEAEIRKMDKMGSPDRQYWEASRELVEAEQFIHSVARLHKYHSDSLTDEHWEDIVKKLGHLADSALDVTKSIEGGVGSEEFIDAEVVPDVRALPAGANPRIVDAEIVDD